ncbi:MAG: DUF3856 domain-containing protein [Armatimonadota bacterium]
MSHPDAEALFRRALKLSCRSSGEGNEPQAWRCLLEALQIEPDHLEALTLAGDLALLEWDDIDCPEIRDAKTGCAIALSYYERALAIEPRHADPWAGKALALVWLGRFEEALAAAEKGLEVLPLRLGDLESPEVYQNVAESLYSDRAQALRGLGRWDEALATLDEGLRLYPDSRLLRGYRPEMVRN